MLATLVDKAFDGQEWLYEIKWDGYRAIAFLENGAVRLISRNQNDFTVAYPELSSVADFVKARTAILDGEIVALDEQGRPSFSLMQQRTGVGEGGRRIRRTRDDIPVMYFVFDLLYLDGYNLMQAGNSARSCWPPSWHQVISSATQIITSETARRCLKRQCSANWKALSPNGATVRMYKSAVMTG